MAKEIKKDQTIWVSGRRKTSVARIKLTSMKGGEIVVNDKLTPEEYFPLELDQKKFYAPFTVTGRDPKGFALSVKVVGGGKKSQLDAIALGISKALERMEEDLRPLLKDAGLLRRDPRMKERKKYGLKRARKAPQYTKR